MSHVESSAEIRSSSSEKVDDFGWRVKLTRDRCCQIPERGVIRRRPRTFLLTQLSVPAKVLKSCKTLD